MASADSPLFRFTMWRAALPPALRLLLTVNLVTYVAFVVVSLVGAFGAPGIGQLLVDGLTLPSDPAAALRVPWTVLTYGFANFFGGFFGLISFAFGVYWLQWMGRDFEEATTVVRERPGQDAAYVIDSSRARTELGWWPATDLDRGLSEVVEWVEDNWTEISRLPLEYEHKP